MYNVMQIFHICYKEDSGLVELLVQFMRNFNTVYKRAKEMLRIMF